MPMEEMKMYPVRKFNVAEAAYSTNLRLKMQEAEGMVRRIAAEGVMDHEE